MPFSWHDSCQPTLSAPLPSMFSASRQHCSQNIGHQATPSSIQPRAPSWTSPDLWIPDKCPPVFNPALNLSENLHSSSSTLPHHTLYSHSKTLSTTLDWLKHSDHLKQNRIKEATLCGNFRARARQANNSSTPTLSGSFQGVRIPSVTSRWSCSLPDKSNCWSLQTRFHEVTSEFKRLDAVNYTLHNWSLQYLSPEKSSHIHGCVLYALDAELSWCSRVQAH